MQLRPYQEDLMDRTRTALGSHKSVLIQAPTGAGKTALTVHMMGRAAQRGNRSFFMVHQNELLSQTSKALWKQKLEHGLIASGKRKSNLPAQVASVQTLVRRLDMYDEPQLIITDECMVAGTIINTIDGPKPIESVSVGDIAMCYSYGQVRYESISDVWSSGYRQVYEVTTSCGKKITCTGNHLIFTHRGWIQAQNLLSTDLMLSAHVDAVAKYMQTSGDTKENGYLGIRLKNDQEKNGKKFTCLQNQMPLFVSAGVEKRSIFHTEKHLIHSLTAKEIDHSVNSRWGMTDEKNHGITKYLKQSFQQSLARFLAILRFCLPIKNQLLLDSLVITGQNKRNIADQNQNFLKILDQKLKLRKTADMDQFISECKQDVLNIYQRFIHFVIKMGKRKSQKNSLIKLEVSGLPGGFVMMDHVQDEEHHCIQRDLTTMNKKSLRHGLQKIMALSTSFLVEKNTKKSQYQQKRNEQFFQSSIHISQTQCNTNWTHIESVVVQEKMQKVYDITIPATGNFFANGLLVHNCHRSMASTYQRIFDRYPNAKLIGLTATPERTDGKGLGDVFETMVMGPSIRWLIDNDYLCDYEIFAPPSMVDVSDVKKIGGDYNKEQLEGILDKSSITGDAVSHYKTHTNGKRCVVMCATIKHAEHVAEQYRLNNINSAVLHGGLSDNERETILSNFAKGIIKVLTNVQLMIEGVDIPAIEVIQWLRPTQSLIVWMQGNGRGFRTHESKDKLVIFDHVGNVLRHGLPDDDREWSLEGRKARTRKKDDDEAVVKIQQCQKCYHIFRPGVHACPSCGAPIEFKPRVELQIIEADLVKVDLDAQRKQAKREQGSARTLRELIQLGLRRGLNKPAEWAVIVECTRKGTKPTAAQFAEAKRVMMEVIKG